MPEDCCVDTLHLHEIREFVKNFQVQNSRLVFLFLHKTFVFIFVTQNFP